MAGMNEGAAWVFAYGSNMHLGDLQRWFRTAAEPWIHPLRTAPAVLPDFRLVWNFYSETRAGGAANVERAPGSTLHGLALLVGREVFVGLDKKEGYPHIYDRDLYTIALRSGERVDAWVYQVRPEKTRIGFVAPTRHYRNLLIQGARTHGLPAAHVTLLEDLETAD